MVAVRYSIGLTALLAFASHFDRCLAQTEPVEQPDLVIEIGAVDPVVLLLGAWVKIPVTVMNLGGSASEPFVIQYLWSDDDEISPDDHVIDTGYGSSVSPLGGSGTSWRGDIGLDPGEYWLGACVAPDATEMDHSNNCSAAVRVIVPNIDRAVSLVDLSTSRIVQGSPIKARAVVRNYGDSETAAARLHFKISSNSSISRGDKNLLEQDVPVIQPGERWVTTESMKIVNHPGKYWIGACIDPVPGEVTENNNCSPGAELEVLTDDFPDLVIDHVAAAPEPWVPGETIDLYAEVRNIGSVSSAPVRVDFYLSLNMDVTERDPVLATVNLSSVKPDVRVDANQYTTPSFGPGSYWLGACVSPDEQEIDVYNNCAPSIAVEIISPELLSE